MGFTENWYSDEQLQLLATVVRRVRYLEGNICEFGCWEGRSTIALAKAAAPEMVIAVDNWSGSHAEGEGHPTVQIAKQRNVYAEFLQNLADNHCSNVMATINDHDEYIAHLAKISARMKFVHIDGAHDYESVHRQIEGLKPLMVKGGIICGDDFLTASAERVDLGGGVERAVRESCPGFEQHGNLWVWVAP